jgi:hypothetical protein
MIQTTYHKGFSILNYILSHQKKNAIRKGSRSNLARAAGFEPTTYGLEDRCSIH